VEDGRGNGVEGVPDLHKYIEFIEMSLGIAARRILAAYQPPRRFIPSALTPPRSLSHTLRSLSTPLPLLLRPLGSCLASSSPSSSSSSSSSLAFIKIAGLIYVAR